MAPPESTSTTTTTTTTTAAAATTTTTSASSSLSSNEGSFIVMLARVVHLSVFESTIQPQIARVLDESRVTVLSQSQNSRESTKHSGAAFGSVQAHYLVKKQNKTIIAIFFSKSIAFFLLIALNTTTAVIHFAF